MEKHFFLLSGSIALAGKLESGCTTRWLCCGPETASKEWHNWPMKPDPEGENQGPEADTKTH